VPAADDFFHSYMGEDPVILTRDGQGRPRADLSDIHRVPGLLGMIVRFGETRGNNLIVADPRTAKMVRRSAQHRRNSLLCLHQGAPLPSPPVASDSIPGHAGAGGARSRAISERISANICRDTATSAIWNVT
jgi:hypothetical protein